MTNSIVNGILHVDFRRAYVRMSAISVNSPYALEGPQRVFDKTSRRFAQAAQHGL